MEHPEVDEKLAEANAKREAEEKKDAIELAKRETVKVQAEARTKLLARLGQLTYDRAGHEAALRDIVAESNTIGEVLQKTEGNG